MRIASWSSPTARGSGKRSGRRSNTATLRPRCPSRPASVAPVGPRPEMITSTWFMLVSASMSLLSTLAVVHRDLLLGQTAQAGMDAPTVGHHQREQNFIGPRRILDADFEAVEVAAYIGGMDVMQGHDQP